MGTRLRAHKACKAVTESRLLIQFLSLPSGQLGIIQHTPGSVPDLAALALGSGHPFCGERSGT